MLCHKNPSALPLKMELVEKRCWCRRKGRSIGWKQKIDGTSGHLWRTGRKLSFVFSLAPCEWFQMSWAWAEVEFLHASVHRLNQHLSEQQGWRTWGGSPMVCLAPAPSLLSLHPVHPFSPPHLPTALLAFCYPLLLSHAVQDPRSLFFFKINLFTWAWCCTRLEWAWKQIHLSSIRAVLRRFLGFVPGFIFTW